MEENKAACVYNDPFPRPFHAEYYIPCYSKKELLESYGWKLDHGIITKYLRRKCNKQKRRIRKQGEKQNQKMKIWSLIRKLDNKGSIWDWLGSIFLAINYWAVHYIRVYAQPPSKASSNGIVVLTHKYIGSLLTEKREYRCYMCIASSIMFTTATSSSISSMYDW